MLFLKKFMESMLLEENSENQTRLGCGILHHVLSQVRPLCDPINMAGQALTVYQARIRVGLPFLTSRESLTRIKPMSPGPPAWQVVLYH